MSNSIQDGSLKKLKLLVTIVDRRKGEFYLDVISEHSVNWQLIIPGTGTGRAELAELLGLTQQKAVILSTVREDKVDEIMNCLDDKFSSIRGGKGISFAVPLSSVIGVNLYRFLSDNRTGRSDGIL